MAYPSLGHRAPLLWLILPLAGGLSLAKNGHHTVALPILFLIALAGCLAALLCAGQRPRLWAGSLVFTLITAGFIHYTLHRTSPPDWSDLPPREAVLQLRVTDLYDSPYPDKTTGLASIIATQPHLSHLKAQRIFFSLKLDPNAPRPLPTTELSALGVIAPVPPGAPPNSFEHYLHDTGIGFLFHRGHVIEQSKAASSFHQFCARSADRFDRILKLGVAEKRPELSQILSAMLLGRKGELSPQQDQLFMHSGTMHLFAISGLHIGVIAVAIHALLVLTRLPAGIRFVLSFIALGLYVVITGSTPSAVRAFTMVVMLQSSHYFRLPGNPLSALAASALLVLCFDPEQLFSASFQMSYGIVLSILLFGLPLGESLCARWAPYANLPESSWTGWQKALSTAWNFFLTSFAISLSAILFSLLSGVQYFGLLTPGALLANLVLIPAATVVILSGMTSLICGLIGFTAGTYLANHAAVLILWAIESAIRHFVTWPGIYHAATFRADWIGPWALSGLVATILFGYACRWRREAGGWWPPFALVFGVLIFGVKFI